MQYRLLRGIHFEKGVKYEQGSVIESDHNLKKDFPDKFALLTGGAGVPAPQEPSTTLVVQVPVEALAEPSIEALAEPLESLPVNDPVIEEVPPTTGADTTPDPPPDAPVVPKPKKKSFVVAKKKRERVED